MIYVRRKTAGVHNAERFCQDEDMIPEGVVLIVDSSVEAEEGCGAYVVMKSDGETTGYVFSRARWELQWASQDPQRVYDGWWVVTDADGTKSAYHPEDFAHEFEECGSDGSRISYSDEPLYRMSDD